MKPITFFDLETTGSDPKTDSIVEIAIIRIENGEEQVYSTYVNPGIPIPSESTLVHGITDEMVKDYPTFPVIAHDMILDLIMKNLFNRMTLINLNFFNVKRR